MVSVDGLYPAIEMAGISPDLILNIDLLYGAIIIVLIGLIMYAIYTGCYLYDEPIQTYRFILNEIEILS